MNTQQAKDIVKQLFPSSFNKSNYASFIKELLNSLDDKKRIEWSGKQVKEVYSQYISKYERIGMYTSNEGETLDVLIVYLSSTATLFRARTALRNFISDHLLLRGSNASAALVAFVVPGQVQWRFSYVKMDYEPIVGDSGKVSLEKRHTPARRYSYIVGENEGCHTAQRRFIDLLKETKDSPNLSDIEEAFSVDAVTSDFFENYKDLFINLNESVEKIIRGDKAVYSDFSSKNISIPDFSKKLMGQIVFLSFLQKKGWLGVSKGEKWGSGPHNFLRLLFNKQFSKYNNFFNDILEPLFYDTLATDRGHDSWCEKFKCRIPFLNGGLFEPIGGYDWRRTNIIIPDSLFSNSEKTADGDIGTGILDVFDRYNFTVNESEPLEKEVAIDPEMLGKVFENLLEIKERKSKGSFYTPREIVHYMCQECLINYIDSKINGSQSVLVPRSDIETFIYHGSDFMHDNSLNADDSDIVSVIPESIVVNSRKIDKFLSELTVCDPAIGSGAFPVGIMHEIVKARSTLTPYFNSASERNSFFFKQHAIENSIYGVDIDPGAVEIAKLRLWLSLVVDEDDVSTIRPLPNLDYKVVSGNSLIGYPFRNADKTLRMLGEIELLKAKVFSETDSDAKAKFKKDITDKIQKCIQEDIKAFGYKVEFDFHVWFSEVFKRGGFDIVIANPPYVGEKGHKEVFEPIKLTEFGRRHYIGKMDLFYYFFHLALEVLRDGGISAFITTNYYITATGGPKLRYALKNGSTILKLINFNELHIFETAPGQHNMITIFKKGRVDDKVVNLKLTSKVGHATPRDLQKILYGADLDTASTHIKQLELYDGDEDQIRFSGVSNVQSKLPLERVMGKMATAGVPLGDNFSINQGIVSGADKVSPKHLRENKIKAVKGDGIFVLSQDEVDSLGIRKKSSDIIKPFFKNSDINRWVTNNEAKEYIIYAKASESNLESAPNILKHLLKFKTIIDNSSSNSPYLHRPRAINFNGPKVVCPQRSHNNTFSYNDVSWYASADVYYITHKDSNQIILKSLCALLNSNLYYVWFYNKGKRKGEMLELYEKPLSETPYPKISNENMKLLASYVDKIQLAKTKNPAADISSLEAEVNKIVYSLFDLTKEEIQAVESFKTKN